jgi:protein-L-isoaspartate(D-aspartate) O-methyltransferase
MEDLTEARHRMVDIHIRGRGIQNLAILEAMRRVPREAFVPPGLSEFAYEDSALPIEAGQTISQPYVVALMIAALQPEETDRILEIGTGSGYAAAVLSRVVQDVYTIERHAKLADLARRRIHDLGYDNVHILQGDGTLGWADHAPYNGIVVTAGGPKIPEALLEQLAPGGRLVMPVGTEQNLQHLVRVTRQQDSSYAQEELGDVRFVPLIGAQGWQNPEAEWTGTPARATGRSKSVEQLIHEVAEPVPSITEADLGPVLDRIGEARVVLIGEASHGTSEFYAMRARLTQALIEHKGFTIVAAEADWPDAARIDHYVRHLARPQTATRKAFSRFPTWMWRNREVLTFVEWLRSYNQKIHPLENRVGFYGLDLYSLFTSVDAVLDYLDDADPDAARTARHRYGCLTPWQHDPAAYGQAVRSGRYETCESEVAAMLQDLLKSRLEAGPEDGERFFDAVQNARLVADAENYYRTMYYGTADAWNLRDRHMFDTLEGLLQFRGPEAKAVIWAHNSHIGNAAATEMSSRGEFNLGQLCRETFADRAFLIGFGTDHGTVAAASNWGEPMQIQRLRPSQSESYERLCHDAKVPAFLLHLRDPAHPDVREELVPARLERAIGVIYRPETELQSHYFHAALPYQFDEYIWFDETRAVSHLGVEDTRGFPDTYPFGL